MPNAALRLLAGDTADLLVLSESSESDASSVAAAEATKLAQQRRARGQTDPQPRLRDPGITSKFRQPAGTFLIEN